MISYVSDSGGKFSSGTTMSFSFAVSGNNPLLAVCIASPNGATATSVDFDGTALTKAVNVQSTSSYTSESSIWYLAAPTAKTANVNITVSSNSGDSWSACAVLLNDTFQSSPTDGTGTAKDASTLQPKITTSFDNTLVLQCGTAHNAGSTFTFASSQTQILNDISRNSTLAVGYRTFTSVQTNLTLQLSAAGSTDGYSSVLVAFKELTGGASGGTLLMMGV